MLETGKKAPDFSLVDQDNETHTLKQYAGKTILLYFYPKDDTPGCTKEACMIADVYGDFQKLNVVVLGVSKDSPKSHKKFAEKYQLPFTLLSDETGSVIQSYEVWKEKSMFGKSFLGIVRASYLIGKNGMILKTYPDVDPATHALEILKDIRELL